MLKKIYVDNYRCLVNFEMKFDTITLLMGPNGGGKTTILDALFGIKQLILDNISVGEVFSEEDITKGQSKDTQTFELHIAGNGGTYVYKLVISHRRDAGNSNMALTSWAGHSRSKHRIETETLHFKGKPLFKFIDGNIHLLDETEEDKSFRTYDDSRSFLSITVPKHSDKELLWFIEWFKKLIVINLIPPYISSVSKEGSPYLVRGCLNFASWYEFFSLEHQDKLYDVVDCLKKTIPGYSSLKLETAGKEKILKVMFRNGDDHKTESFDFSRLSDGQKVLIILYTIVMGLKDLDYTILFDEPENYLALAEIQPWLMELNNCCSEGSIRQTILISHHPELIDFFGADCSKWLEKEPLGHSRVKKLPSGYKMKTSEQIARGWTE